MNDILIKASYNPHDALDLSNLRIGGHTVMRRPLAGTPRVRYLIMENGQIAGQQISYPTPSDCNAHVRRFADGHASRAGRRPSIIERAHGTITERLVEILRMEAAPLTVPQLAGAMKVSTDTLSPVLNKLVKSMRITRHGAAAAPSYTTR